MSYEVVVVAYHVGSIWKLGNQIEGDYEIRATDLSHNIILGYKLLSRALKPGLYGGGFIAHHLQVHKTGLSDNPHFGEIYPEQLYFGFLAGAGISYEAFENRDLTLKLLYKIGFDNFAYFKTGQFVVSLTLPFFNIKL